MGKYAPYRPQKNWVDGDWSDKARVVRIGGADDIAALVAQLSILPQRLQQIRVASVNAVLQPLLKHSRELVRREVRLRDDYIRLRTGVLRATLQDETAYFWGRERRTRLATYQSRQATTAAPGAKGDPMRGIAPGRKQAGIVVAVERETQPTVGAGKFFYVPQRRGKVARAQGFGIFVRQGPGKKDIRHLYGMSVALVLNWHMDELRARGRELLHDELSRRLTEAVSRADASSLWR